MGRGKLLSIQKNTEELDRKLSELKKQNDKLTVEMNGWAEKRDKLNNQHRNLRNEIAELRNHRNKTNEEVKELKQKRSETKAKILEEVEALKNLGKEAKATAKQKPSRRFQVLQKEFESLEWKVQTTPFNAQEERSIIDEIRQLENQLNVYKKLQRINQDIFEIRNKLKALEVGEKSCHEKLTTLAGKSQELHEKMLVKIKEANKVKAEADSLHQTYLVTKEKLKVLYSEMREVLAQMNRLRDKMREGEEKKRKDNEVAIRSALEEQAKEKLRRGEKLSWEEFQLLGEKGIDT